MDPLLCIANADAGSTDDANLQRALEVLRGATDVEVCSTSNPGELDGVLHRRGGRQVVVAGGDGSMHAVVAALHRRNELEHTVVGLVPLGTGNDFARGARIPLDPVVAAEVIVAGNLRPIDLLVDCFGEIVVNNVHVGVGAEASRMAASWKRTLGRPAYAVGALAAAVNPPFVRLRVEVDGAVVTNFDRPVVQVALGNGSTVGGGAQLTPEANPGDGQMDVLVSFASGPLARFAYAARLGLGRHHQRQDVLYTRGSTVTISGQEYFCSADGEVYGPERHRTWHLEPAAFLMPLPD